MVWGNKVIRAWFRICWQLALLLLDLCEIVKVLNPLKSLWFLLKCHSYHLDKFIRALYYLKKKMHRKEFELSFVVQSSNRTKVDSWLCSVKCMICNWPIIVFCRVTSSHYSHASKDFWDSWMLKTFFSRLLMKLNRSGQRNLVSRK